MHSDKNPGAKRTQTFFRSAPCGVPRLLAALLGAYVPPHFFISSFCFAHCQCLFRRWLFFLLSSTECCQVQVGKEIRIWCREFRVKEDLEGYRFSGGRRSGFCFLLFQCFQAFRSCSVLGFPILFALASSAVFSFQT